MNIFSWVFIPLIKIGRNSGIVGSWWATTDFIFEGKRERKWKQEAVENTGIEQPLHVHSVEKYNHQLHWITITRNYLTETLFWNTNTEREKKKRDQKKNKQKSELPELYPWTNFVPNFWWHQFSTQ